ncbi:MAG: AI-2E family transporter [Thermodesulfobacteriota bacterium]
MESASDPKTEPSSNNAPEESAGLKQNNSRINQRLLKSGRVEGRIMMGLLVLGIFYTIYFARGLLLPIVIALLLAALLQPAVSFLTRFKVPNALAAILVLVLLVSVLSLVAYRIAAPASEWFDRRPYLVSQLEYKLGALKNSLEEAKETTKKLEKLTELTDEIEEGEGEGEGQVVVKGPTLSDRIMVQGKAMAIMLAIVLVLTYFLLSRGRPTLKHMAEEIEDQGQERKWAKIMVQVQQEVALYLVTIAMINVFLGALTAAAMALLKMPNPVLWGVVAMTLNFVPYLGAMVTTLIIATVSLVTFTSWPQILLPPFVFLCFTALEGQFVTPTIVGKRLQLNPIAVIISLLFWGWIWGIGGMLISVPILAAIKIIVKSTEELKAFQALIG